MNSPNFSRMTDKTISQRGSIRGPESLVYSVMISLLNASVDSVLFTFQFKKVIHVTESDSQGCKFIPVCENQT